MLKAPSQFPHPGSTAFERATGVQVRIIRTNEGGSVTVSGDSKRHGTASGIRTVALKSLCERWPPRRAYNRRAAA
ncbi:MAG: hypothetical protein ACK4ZW_05755 [Blastomonas sp.]